MLKPIVASLDGIDVKYHVLYTKQDDGTYKLDSSIIPSNIEDVTGLKSTNSDLKIEKTALQMELDDLKASNKQKEEVDLVEGKEYEKLLGIKTTQFDEKITAANSRADKAVLNLKSSLQERAVMELAVRLAGDSAALLIPHLKDRVQVNEVGEQYVVQVTDINGTPSALTMEDLGKEFKANKLFEKVLLGRQSSGGGSSGGSGGSGGTEEYAKYFDRAGPEYNTEKQYELEQKDKKAHDALVKKYGLDDIYN